MKINSLYICVDNMNRALNFYSTKIFNCPAASATERFSYFDIDGFLFCLFNPNIDGEPHIKGNNCIPTIEVEDVLSLLEKFQSENVNVIMDLNQVGDYHLFQCKDSEDNILEFYQIK